MKHPSHLHGFAIRCITARGFALPTLMVMLALTSIATLLAIRNLWVNDQLLNAEADQLRTQSKAEAALPVALADILGTATNSNEESTPNLRHSPRDCPLFRCAQDGQDASRDGLHRDPAANSFRPARPPVLPDGLPIARTVRHPARQSRLARCPARHNPE